MAIKRIDLTGGKIFLGYNDEDCLEVEVEGFQFEQSQPLAISGLDAVIADAIADAVAAYMETHPEDFPPPSDDEVKAQEERDYDDWKTHEKD